MRTTLDELLSLAHWQLLARAVVLLAPAAALASAEPLADRALPTTVLLIVVGLGALTAAFPDSHVGSVTLVVLVLVWLVHVDRTTSPWTLAAALAVTAFHTAATLAAFAPPGATLDTIVRRRWSVRVGLILALVTTLWVLIVVIDSVDSGSNGAIFVVGLVTLGVGALFFRRSARPT